MRHGIDLKTHSQCQRSATLTDQHDRLTWHPIAWGRIWFRFNNRKFDVPGTSPPPVAAKPRPLARFTAPIGLAAIRSKLRLARSRLRPGGAYRDRTDDPLLAKQVLSQLS
jgi:hypothetical protein